MLRAVRLLSALLFGAGLFLCLARSAPAQLIRWHNDTPNCHLFHPHPDNPFSTSRNYTQPAIAWDAEYAAVSLGVGSALHRWTRLPAWVDALVPTIGLGLVPHVVGYAQGRYPMSLHWAFVLWDRSTPAFWLLSRHHMRASAEWLAGYAALACFDR